MRRLLEMGKPITARMVIDYNQVEKIIKDLYSDIRRIKSHSSPEKDIDFMNRMTKFQAALLLCMKVEIDKK